MAANGADGSLGGGVADYQVNGEITYVLLDSGTEAIADGDTWSMTYNTDAINDADELNIVGVRISMSYGEDETSSGFGCMRKPSRSSCRIHNHRWLHRTCEFNGTADGLSRTTAVQELMRRWRFGTTNPWLGLSSPTFQWMKSKLKLIRWVPASATMLFPSCVCRQRRQRSIAQRPAGGFSFR